MTRSDLQVFDLEFNNFKTLWKSLWKSLEILEAFTASAASQAMWLSTRTFEDRLSDELAKDVQDMQNDFEQQ